jgi:hypothetical protein
MLLVLNRPDEDPLNIDPLAGAHDNVERTERLGFAAAFIQIASRQDDHPGLIEPGAEQLQNIVIRTIGQLIVNEHYGVAGTG